MASKTSAPIIICGQAEAVAKVVIPGMQPEYETIHFCMGIEDCVRNVPRLLAGQQPENPASQIGTSNYSQLAHAVVLGGAFSPEMRDQIRNAVRTTEGARLVPFLQYDPAKSEGMPTPHEPGYPASVPVRVKASLQKLDKQGVLNGKDDGVYGW